MMKDRPILKDLVNSNTLVTEKFQNQTLRPIIKMQNDLILTLFQNYISKKKILFLPVDNPKNNIIIESIFQKDINFKHLILGVIIGHFTADELEIYTKNTSEYHKRMVQIIVQRIQDQLLK